MRFNYLKTSLRKLAKRRGFALINVGGLALGVACFILIGLFVRDELSYDTFHEKSDRIYRIAVHLVMDGNESDLASGAAPLGQAFVNDFPEVEAATRLVRRGAPVMRYGDVAFSEPRFYWADSTLADVFTIPFLQGDPETALIEPWTVVLTRTMAEKYFPDEDPIGKILVMDGRQDYRVTGVVEDVPQNSHYHYDFLGSLASVGSSRGRSFAGQNNWPTYIVLAENAKVSDLEAKLPGFIEQHIHPEVNAFLNITPAQFYENGGEFGYMLQPLTDIHLTSHLRFEHENNGNLLYVYIFAGIALAILIIACINYVNLSTAISTGSAREVGIRKSVGSTRAQLIVQFLSDSLLLSTMAVGVSLLIVEFSLPWLNQLTSKELNLEYLSGGFSVPVLLVLALAIGFLAGGYPAFFLSSFKPIAVLRGRFTGSKSKSAMRQGLVVFQYAVSASLVIGALVVYGQLEFIQNRNLGFDGDQVVVVKKTDDLGARYIELKEKLSGMPSITSLSTSYGLIGDGLGDNLYRVSEGPIADRKMIYRMTADAGYRDTYMLELVSGRYFSEDMTGEVTAVILNESAVELLGFEDPIGTQITSMGDTDFTIIGVAKDFHVESLQKEIKPVAIHYLAPPQAGRYLSIRLANEDIMSSMAQIEEAWASVAGGLAFEYEFFDDHFEETFLAEKNVGQLLIIFSVLAIIIACLGLFGLAAFVTTQRTKEIGIRKALGATAPGIVRMLFQEFGRWILLANLIAWPVAYFGINNWLNNFVYRGDIGLLVFPLSLLAAMIVALATISYQAVRAAKANPVVALRHE